MRKSSFLQKLAIGVACMLALTAPARVALAHDGQPIAPHDLWDAWNWEPAVWLGLGLSAWVYTRGLRALWRRGKEGRAALAWRGASFAAGLIALFIALISPLDRLGAALFSAHMVQHMALILIAAPLLVLGAPLGPLLLGLPESMRRDLGRWWRRAGPNFGLRAGWRAPFGHPLVAWSLQVFALWAWHAPGLYQAALQSELVHPFQHLSFLGTALLFWWVIMTPPGKTSSEAQGLGYGLAVFALFTTTLQSGLLGALITFAPRPWYAAYTTTTALWNLTPLEDQQLAGAVMWILGGVVYGLAALFLFMVWLTAIERESQAWATSDPQGVHDLER
jgi:putative membrane protein